MEDPLRSSVWREVEVPELGQDVVSWKTISWSQHSKLLMLSECDMGMNVLCYLVRFYWLVGTCGAEGSSLPLTNLVSAEASSGCSLLYCHPKEGKENRVTTSA